MEVVGTTLSLIQMVVLLQEELKISQHQHSFSEDNLTKTNHHHQGKMQSLLNIDLMAQVGIAI